MLVAAGKFARWSAGCCLSTVALLGCTSAKGTASAAPTPAVPAPVAAPSASVVSGFDRNDYPGDSVMASMRQKFAFTGYWITPPPGETSNSWTGKRALLRAQGWGFLVLANGRFDAEILKAQKGSGGKPKQSPAQLAEADAAAAVASARREGFPAHSILFLDQEEGGRLLDEQSAYLLAWTEAVAASGFVPGVYASGQPVPDEPGKTITTIDHIRSLVATRHLHEISMFDAQDHCPPAPGCAVQAPALDTSGEHNLVAWQYAQSPQRPEFTQSCAKTYTAGNCYAAGFPDVSLDRDAARSADPSNGR